MLRCRKKINLIIIVVMLINMMAGIGMVKVSAFEAGAVVEAESGSLANSMTAYGSILASQEQCISVASGNRLDAPESLAQPDARYSFNITTAGSYKVYLRSYAPSAASDSYWYRWDNASSYTVRYATVSSGWSWEETNATTLAVGTHTLDICHREPGYYIDLMVVATNLTTAEKSAIDESIAPSAAATFNTTSGSVMFEAENTTLNSSLFSTTADAAASNGNVVRAATAQTSPAPSPSQAGIEFNIVPDRTAKYDVWIRYSAISSAQDSVWYSFDGAAYVNKGLTVTGTDPSDYKWMKLDSTSSSLYYGGRYSFKLYPRESGVRIDKIVVTLYPFFTPSGNVATFDNMSSYYALSATAYPAPTITPPSAHPRLYFKSSDINGIKTNMQKSQNANALTAYNNYLAQNVDGVLGTFILTDSNYNSTVLANIEAYALKYALDGDITYGNKAVTAMKNYLNTLILEYTEGYDITRPRGHVINVASIVYDWCYPLLTDTDKNDIIVACESIAKGMEVGYPPSGQGAVSGHGGELQLFRDLLSFGIAVYNERPDIYNFVAGRLLSEYIEPRNYWYSSGTHHQGDSYGSFRYYPEMMFQWIMKRMSGETVFSSSGEFVPYQWIYTRRPDGQTFRNGDDFQEYRTNIGTYWSSDKEAVFYSGNFYGNSFVKQQYIAYDPNYNLFSLAMGTLTPVTFLLFNNPDLAGQSHTSTFPLTKYFGSPYGMMVARTGWTEPGTVNLSSNVAMAQMIIGEQWAANHQHLDAGSFQLYYKGALASESGVYDDYGSSHDKNYNKETIAHNSLLIYDPNETMYGGIANSGGQKRPGGEVNTFSEWMNAGYDRSTVLDYEYDTTNTVPLYSYIKGDITKAYTNKVSEVLRSMIFMPLSDANHPAAFIVMDKVTSSNSSFTKTWLLHLQQEPTITGNTAIVKRDTDGYNGRMDLTTLLPSNAAITKVGGSGHEFDINGTNYPPTGTFGTACEKGAWRVEVKPSSSNTTDYFLNVMQVSDASANATPLAATLIETNSVAGAKLDNRVAIFGKNKGRITDSITYTVPGNETNGLKTTVCGVAAGGWKVYRNNTLVGTYTATEAGGTLYFEGGAGDYSIVRLSSDASLSSLTFIHPELGTQVVTLNSGTTNYNVELPYGISSAIPEVSAVANDAAASVAITQASSTEGSAAILVTAENNNQVTYTLNFTVSQTPFGQGNGTVTNLKYRGTAASGTFSAVEGVQATSPINIYTNSAYPTQADKVAAATNSAVNLYKNNNLRVYADRDTTSGGNGASSSALIGSYAEFAYLNTTSGVFLGNNVTRIVTYNNEKSNSTAVSNAYSFTISKPAKVYIAAPGTFTNIANSGWALDNTGLVVKRAAVSGLQYTSGLGADNKYYAIPNGSSSNYNGIYYRHYSAGANVEVPSAGAATNSGIIVLIVWDE